jgi:hypothetical protein
LAAVAARDDADPCVEATVLVQNGERRIARAVIQEQKLKSTQSLPENALDSQPEILLPIVNWENDTD